MGFASLIEARSAISNASRGAVAALCYFFLPLGGGGTPRSVTFAKFLPRHSCQPVVFTGSSPANSGNREFTHDDSQGDAAADLPIIRVPERAGVIERATRCSRAWPLFWTMAYPWLWETQLPWARRLVHAIVAEHGFVASSSTGFLSWVGSLKGMSMYPNMVIGELLAACE